MPAEVWSLVLDPRRITPSVLPPSYFLLDGDDWLAHILNKDSIKSANADAESLDAVVRQLHWDLNGMGIRPIVFLERVASKNIKNKFAPTDSTDTQKLQLQQLRKTLKSLSVDIEECDSVRRAGAMLEFYHGMASKVEYSCYIYGSASLDLWAVRGVSYILFDTLSISVSGNKVQAPVWSRSIVAAALFVNEKQLGELMILVGNKYTAPFGRRGFKSATGTNIPPAFLELEEESKNDRSKGREGRDMKLKADDMISLAAMRDWILKQGTAHSIKFHEKSGKYSYISPFSSADKAIEFSRIYYENGDILKFVERLEQIDASVIAKNEKEAIKNGSIVQPKSCNAAAAIMAAISGSGFGKNVTLSLKEPEKEKVEEKVVERRGAREKKKVEVTKASSSMKFSEKEIDSSELAVKDVKERRKGREGREKLIVEVKGTERTVEKVVEKGEKGGREKKEKKEKTEGGRIVVISPRSSFTTPTPIVTATVDEDKGAQLRNLLGLKFGALSIGKAPSTSTTTATIPATVSPASITSIAAVTNPTAPTARVPPPQAPSASSVTPVVTPTKKEKVAKSPKERTVTPATQPVLTSEPYESEIDPQFSMKIEPRKRAEGGSEKSTVSPQKSAATAAAIANTAAAIAAASAAAAVSTRSTAAVIANTAATVAAGRNQSTTDVEKGTLSVVEVPAQPPVTATSLAMAAVHARLAEARVKALAALSTPSSSFSPSRTLRPQTSSKLSAELPIDAHKDKILEHVAKHRVTIIHGMTGCGKSSRLPQMILEKGEAEGKHTMIMVSQPRRIAAQALKNRLHETLGNKVGLKLGNGVKEETPETRLWFVTCGYLVRVLAHRMESFRKYTHLIIDEVHERSADGDILCLLAKKVMEVLPHIKVILMSATAHTALYEGYFNVRDETIFVGVRRFPQQFIYCDDLYDMIPGAHHNCIRTLIDATSVCRGYQGETVADHIVKEQLTLAVALTKQIASEQSSVLIFVSGMADINELLEKFEKVKTKQLKLKVIAIHSDIPFEEQFEAFKSAGKGESKVIIATNAAESSLTLPDCDHVICLGTHKMLSYNDKHNASQLMKCWISKASAQQRAGRTGRMRPGTVYRLYTAAMYNKLPDHELSEVNRLPLSEIILRVRVMLENDPKKPLVKTVVNAAPAATATTTAVAIVSTTTTTVVTTTTAIIVAVAVPAVTAAAAVDATTITAAPAAATIAIASTASNQSTAVAVITVTAKEVVKSPLLQLLPATVVRNIEAMITGKIVETEEKEEISEIAEKVEIVAKEEKVNETEENGKEESESDGLQSVINDIITAVERELEPLIPDNTTAELLHMSPDIKAKDPGSPQIPDPTPLIPDDEIKELEPVISDLGSSVIPDPEPTIPDLGSAIPDFEATIPDLGPNIPDLGSAIPDLASIFVCDSVVPILMALLEPPEMTRVNRSLQYLYDVGMITTPDDAGQLTETGKVAGRLPIDLILGRFVSYGVILDLTQEAVIIAAALSLPKSPFRIANAIIHSDPDEYNKIVKDSFYSRARLDRGHLSEPLMLLSTLLEWRACESEREKFNWCQSNCIAHARMRSFNSVAVNLQSKLTQSNSHSHGRKGWGEKKVIASASSKEETVLAVSVRTGNMLRLMMTWAFHSNLLLLQKPASQAGLCLVQVPVMNINADMIDSIFNPTSARDRDREREKEREREAGHRYDDANKPSYPGGLAINTSYPSPPTPSAVSPIIPSLSSSWDETEKPAKTIKLIKPIMTGYSEDENMVSPTLSSFNTSPRSSSPTRPSSPPTLTLSTSTTLSSTTTTITTTTTTTTAITAATIIASLAWPETDPKPSVSLPPPETISPTSSVSPEVQWRMLAEGRRIYTAEYTDRSFENLLSSFTSCVQDMHVPVAWLHSKESAPHKTIIIMIDKLAPRILEFLKSVYPNDLEILGSYEGMTVARNTNTSGSNSDKQIGRLEELYNENLSVLSWTLPANVAVKRSGSSGSSNIYNNNKSSSNIYSSIDTNNSTSSNNIYSAAPWSHGRIGPAVLVCANCMAKDTQISRLFLGEEDKDKDKDKKDKKESTQDWKYSSKLVRSKMIIEFLPDAPSAYSGGGVDIVKIGNNGNNGNRNSDKNGYSDNNRDNGRNRNSSGGGGSRGDRGIGGKREVHSEKDQLDSNLRWTTGRSISLSDVRESLDPDVDDDSRDNTDNRDNKDNREKDNGKDKENRDREKDKVDRDTDIILSKGIVIPRCEIISEIPLGIRLLNSIRLGGRGDRNSLCLVGRGEGFDGTLREGKEISIKVQAEDSSWVANRLGNIGITGSRVEELLDTSNKSRRVMMSNHSLQQVAQHTGKENVYAVSYTLNLVGDDATRAEGVTLLPVGKKWTALAFECAGIDSSGLNLTSEEELNNDDMSQVLSIKKQLKGTPTKTTTDDLWKSIETLFSSWIRAAERQKRVDNAHINKEQDDLLLRDYERDIGDDILLRFEDGKEGRKGRDGKEGRDGVEGGVSEKDPVVEKELSTAAWLFQGCDVDAKPIKAKRLKPIAPVENPNAGWWTASKK